MGFVGLSLFAQNTSALNTITGYSHIRSGTTCSVNLSDTIILVFCDWTKALKECKSPCWLNWYSEELIMRGVAQHAIAGHHAWLKELTVSDLKGNSIVSEFDSITNMALLQRVGPIKARKFLHEGKRYLYPNISKENPKIERGGWNWREPSNAKERLE